MQMVVVGVMNWHSRETWGDWNQHASCFLTRDPFRASYI